VPRVNAEMRNQNNTEAKHWHMKHDPHT